MSKLSFLYIGLAIWLFSGAYLFSTRWCGINSAVSSIPSKTITDGQFSTTVSPGFFFLNSDEKLNGSEATHTALNDLAAHLKNNPNRLLTLMGNYSPQEKNNTKFQNLGLARSASVKGYLIAQGVNENQIATAAQQKNSLQIVDEDKIIDGIDFHFSNFIANNDVKPTPISNNKNTKFKPLNLKFPKSQYKLVLTDELENYFDDLIKYLDEHKEANVSVVGHTDNTGNRKDNLRISKYRVRKVRDYLAKKGLSLKRINIDYKGSDEPIASNDTAEGREKNRRVEIRIK